MSEWDFNGSESDAEFVEPPPKLARCAPFGMGGNVVVPKPAAKPARPYDEPAPSSESSDSDADDGPPLPVREGRRKREAKPGTGPPGSASELDLKAIKRGFACWEAEWDDLKPRIISYYESLPLKAPRRPHIDNTTWPSPSSAGNVQHPPAPPPRVQRKRGAESRYQAVEDRKTADDSTPSAALLVDDYEAFTFGFLHTDGCISFDRGDAERRARLNVRFCQSNPSALLALKKAWGWDGIAALRFMEGPTHTGRAHDGHSEHQLVLGDDRTGGPIQLGLLNLLHEALIVKRHQAGLALRFQEVKHRAKEDGVSVVATNARLEPIMAAMEDANGIGPKVWPPRHEHLAVTWLEAMSGEAFLAWFCGACAGNGGTYLRLAGTRSRPQFNLSWGRDAPGLLVLVWRRLGFGALGRKLSSYPSEKGSTYYPFHSSLATMRGASPGWCQTPAGHLMSLCCKYRRPCGSPSTFAAGGNNQGACPGVPGGWYSTLRFESTSDLGKLLAVFLGSGVTLADGTVVPATASGRPRLFIKLLKFITLLAYCQRHGSPNLQAAKYIMAATDATGQRGWWTDAKHWRYMCAALWPGLPIPDHEH